ncbi:MAG TPA: hypothetical protein VHZ76_05585 [Gammaproteobacteria bacterium]|nr:hypothetical protein [Gammaproteobacteria bacterium]
MNTNPLIKLLAIPLIVVVAGLTLVSLFIGRNKQPSVNGHDKAIFLSDKASSDTPVETLKTLTAKLTQVEQQNQKIIEQNKVLSEQDKTILLQFKNEVLAEVSQQIDNVKQEVKSYNSYAPMPNINVSENHQVVTETHRMGFAWVQDMQQGHGAQDESILAGIQDASTSHLSDLLKQVSSKDEPARLALLNDGMVANHRLKEHPKTQPYYTIPVNATLTGAIAMQPIIGRIPINGRVPDPYTFKVIISAYNLAANGVDMPEALQGIVASGIASGDLLGRCARGDIRSMTFIFADGRISTTEAKEGQVLGTIAAANGNPCLRGSFHTDAPLFLGVTAGLAGVQGYSNALSQSEVMGIASTTGDSISTLIGSANKYAAGQGFSAAAQAAQKWWEQRVESSFDFVFVPHVDAKTGKKLKLNINITEEIPIDYDSTKRKVFYSYDRKGVFPDLD